MSLNKKEKKNAKNKNRKRGYKNFNPVFDNNILVRLRKIILACLIFIIFYPPFLRGLFFESEQLFTEIFVFVVYILFWVYKFLKRDRRFLSTPIDYAALSFVFVYFLSLFPAIDKHLAVTEWLKYCMFFALFHIVSEIATTYRSKRIILWAVVVTAFSISVIGLDALAGGKFVNLLNKFFNIIRLPQVLHLKEMFFELTMGNRISSVFQYPNTLAAYNMAVFFIIIGLIITSEKLWIKLINGCAGFILFVTFILTSSRGAYLMFPVAMIIFILALPKKDRIKGLFYSAIYMMVGVVLSFKILSVSSTSGSNYNKYWMYIALGTVASVAITVAMSYIIKLLERLNWKVYVLSLSFLIIIGAFGLVYVFNTTLPVELSNMETEGNNWKTVQRSVVLKPGNEYKLIFDVEASMKEEKPYAYSVNVDSRNIKDILSDKFTRLESLTGKATNGVEKAEISFKVPEDSKIVRIYFANLYQGTKAKFYNAIIQDAESGKIVKELALKYKYIPESLASRLDDIWASKSGVQRLVYYKEGLELIKDRPILGAGGGAWSLLYFMYQSYLYFSTQAHNYFIQLGVETGIVGFLALIFLLVSFVIMFLIKFNHTEGENTAERVLQSSVFAAICALFMHSFIDFDFSLTSIFMLVWVLLGLNNSFYKNKEASSQEMVELNNKFTQKVYTHMKKISYVKKTMLAPTVGIIISILIMVLPALLLAANNYASKTNTAIVSKNYELALANMRKASNFNPLKTSYKIDYASLLVKTKSSLSNKEKSVLKEYVSDSEKAAKYDASISRKVGAYHLATGNIDKGLEFFNNITHLIPLDPNIWQERINAYTDVVMYYLQNNDMSTALNYANKTLSIIDEAKLANEKNMIPFVFNINTIEALERMSFLVKNHEKISYDNINKIVFKMIPGLDVNIDNMPDQFSVGNVIDTKVEYEGGTLVVDNTKVGYGNLITRRLNLSAGKNYRISIELSNPDSVERIDFNLVGVSKENKSLTKSGKWYTGEVTVPSDFEPGNNILYLGIPGKAIIEEMVIYEQGF